MPKPLPEHVVAEMAKEIAKYLAPLYPKRSLDWLENQAEVMLAKEPIFTPWPDPIPDLPGRVYLTITVGWYDRILQLAHIGDSDGPRWWTEERGPEPLKPESERGPFDW
jgi:hypothetical protein